jgi:16S rRNA (adenine1518-N6/adenine1519-N6)-dimethyltransferase
MDLKQLKEIWKQQGFSPRKSLGQNFLIDNNVKDKIFRSLALSTDSTVIEIGPGFGVMSFDLADRCGRLIAIDKDRKICEIMEDRFKSRDNITLINADVLEADICGFAREGKPLTVYGNIPYYISTPIIEKIIECRQCIDKAFIVMQDELANRIVSAPGSRDYGSLSCFVQYYTKAEKLFRIKRNCFYPSPKVDSCILALTILPEPSVTVKDERLMFKIIRKAFSQRRKKAINSLSSGEFLPMDREGWQEAFTACGIDLSSRAEVISLGSYARLTDLIEERL